jgi:hypothetical protein
MKCQVVSRYVAMLVDSKDVPDMAAGLGNPMLCKEKQPDEERKQMIKNWFEKTDSDEVPNNARHLVLWNCYFCAMENQMFQFNVVEVSVLEERGAEISGYEKAYFPVYRIQEWLKDNCCKQKRRRHVMSKLRREARSLLPCKLYGYNV